MLRALLWTKTPALARGFCGLGAPGLELEASAAGIHDFAARVEEWNADLVLLDCGTQVDFTLIAELRTRRPTCCIVLWTDSISVEIAHQARAAGIRGVLRKSAPDEMVIRCMQAVRQGPVRAGDRRGGGGLSFRK